MSTYLEYRDRSKHTFWQIEVDGATVTTTQGRVGARKAPKPKSKTLKSEDAARKSAEKAVARKLAADFFDPSTLEGILASHHEQLRRPTDAEIEAHRAECPHAPDDYFEVCRTGALDLGSFDEFGKVDEDHPDDPYDEVPQIFGAHSAADVLDEEAAALDPFFYLLGSLYDGSALVQYNQGRYAGRLGVIDHGPSEELLDHIVEGDADATMAAWLEEKLIEPPDEITLREYLRFRLLHHKGAAVSELQELRAAMAALKEAIEGDPSEVTELDLSDKGLRMLPDFLAQCTDLRVLRLRENEFDAVPPVVQHFEKLEVLDLYYNPLNSNALPPWLADRPLRELNLAITRPEGPFSDVIPRLTELEVLRLSDMASLPASIGELSKLRHLSASVEGPVEPGGVGRLRELRTLRLGRITSLPDDIGQLDQLEDLSFDATARDAFVLPDTMGGLRSLKRLVVGSAVLPPCIGELSSLTYLKVSGNEQGLPESVSQLGSLVELDLQYARTPSLPEAIGRLQALEVLNLESAYVERLPPSFAELRALRSLRLATVAVANTVVGDVLGQLTNLEFLTLNWQTLHTLQGRFDRLERLHTVKVYTGTRQEGDFIELMAWVHQLPHLKVLGVPYEFKQHFAEALPGVQVT